MLLIRKNIPVVFRRRGTTAQDLDPGAPLAPRLHPLAGPCQHLPVAPPRTSTRDGRCSLALRPALAGHDVRSAARAECPCSRFEFPPRPAPGVSVLRALAGADRAGNAPSMRPMEFGTSSRNQAPFNRSDLRATGRGSRATIGCEDRTGGIRHRPFVVAHSAMQNRSAGGQLPLFAPSLAGLYRHSSPVCRGAFLFLP